MREGWTTIGVGGKPLEGMLNLVMVGGKRYRSGWYEVDGVLAHLWRKPNIFNVK